MLCGKASNPPDRNSRSAITSAFDELLSLLYLLDKMYANLLTAQPAKDFINMTLCYALQTLMYAVRTRVPYSSLDVHFRV